MTSEREASTGAFTLTTLAGGIASVSLDVEGSELNLLNPSHAADLSATVDALKQWRDLSAVVITSGRSEVFSAGADLHRLAEVRAVQDGIDMARAAQRAITRWTHLGVPTVAVIDGPCLGAAAAIVLGADIRLATGDPTTQLGFPEVNLGLVPTGGAAFRLIDLVGLPDALDLLVTGRSVSASEGKELGLIDVITTRERVEELALAKAREQVRRRREQSRVAAAVLRRLDRVRHRVVNNRVHRALALREAQARLRERPAAYRGAAERLLKVVRTGLERGLEAGLEAERRTFGELLGAPEATHLITHFLDANALRREATAHQVSSPLDSLGVVGAGELGLGIAARSARAGLSVRLRDRSTTTLAQALTSLRERLEGEVATKTLSPAERDRILGRLTITTEYGGFTEVRFVVDTSRKGAETKRQLVREIEAHGAAKVVIATLTITARVAELAKGANTKRVIGWVQPTEPARLVELAVLDDTSPRAIEMALEITQHLGLTAVVVRDSPCFFTPRLIGAWHNESLRLVAEGVAPHEVDEALTEWGFEQGPMALLAKLGHDSSLRVQQALERESGERMALPRIALEMLRTGELRGPRTRARGVRPPAVPRRDIVQRCVMRLVNESVLCFGEGVVQSARDANVATVLAVGFPASRGGPLRYVEEVGVTETVRRLQRLTRTHGPRFEPAALLVRMVRSGGTFHGDARVSPGTERFSEGTR